MEKFKLKEIYDEFMEVFKVTLKYVMFLISFFLENDY